MEEDLETNLMEEHLIEWKSTSYVNLMKFMEEYFLRKFDEIEQEGGMILYQLHRSLLNGNFTDHY